MFRNPIRMRFFCVFSQMEKLQTHSLRILYPRQQEARRGESTSPRSEKHHTSIQKWLASDVTKPSLLRETLETPL